MLSIKVAILDCLEIQKMSGVGVLKMEQISNPFGAASPSI